MRVGGRVRVLLASAALLGVACATGGKIEWQRAGATQAELESDRRDCIAEASSAMSGAAGSSHIAGSRDFDFCMESRGWRRVQQ